MKKTTRIFIRFLVALMTVVLLATSVSAYSTVRKGSSGSDVRTLQTMLNEVQDADLDVDGKFGSATLTAVKKYQKLKGLDADGIVGTKTWSALESDYKKATAKAPSTLKIGSGKYSPGTLKKGSSYSISGSITSNYKITSVTVGIYKTDGTKVQSKSATPNAKSYNINKLDSYIKFGNLAAGSYSFKVTAKDASGKTKTLVNNSFKVTAPAASTLKIGSGKYAPGTLKKGSSYSISGSITSNYKITSVTVGIYKTDGTKVQAKSAKPNAKSYNISKLDSSIKFGNLAIGSYQFKVSAKDASGKTKTLVNNTFKVTSSYIPSPYKNVAEFEKKALAKWQAPVKAEYLKISDTPRAFGASRNSGKRNHAGIDYYVKNGAGTPVYAMQDGKVIEYTSKFYAGTQAVAVQHADGSVARYCEISTSLRKGDTVKKGQQVGKMKANTEDGGTMLHLELYLGTESGSLSKSSSSSNKYSYVSGKFNRRKDLINPEFLQELN